MSSADLWKLRGQSFLDEETELIVPGSLFASALVSGFRLLQSVCTTACTRIFDVVCFFRSRKVLREWCPWDSSNDVLSVCFQASILRPEERDPAWDPMDIDSDSDDEPDEQCPDDAMDLS